MLICVRPFTPIDFVASCVRDAFGCLRDKGIRIHEAAWLGVRIGADDLQDAYRGHPVAERHLPVPAKGWRFTVLYGLAYGLEAAVVAFNRLPMLGVAASSMYLIHVCGILR